MIYFLQISIPYGAIKRLERWYKFAKYYEFQFLMVRLKAIKTNKIYEKGNKFQFLMVRLKETIVIYYYFFFFYFNSLWCD